MAVGGVDEPGSTTPMSGDAIAAGMHALYRMLLSDSDLDATLGRVAALAAASLPMCDLADVTLIRDEQPVTKGATDERAHALDAVQYSTGAGPCLEACRTRQPVHVDSTRRETRWPQYAAAAVDAGVLSMMAIPLLVRHAVIGALNLYSYREHAFSDNDDQIGKLFADQAAIALANAQTHDAAVRLARQLQEALESRGPIDQAKGILMARHACSAETAFEMLVERSQHENRKLRLVADDVVEEAQRTL